MILWELILLFIFFVSGAGLLMMFFKKIPTLLTMPANGNFFLKIKENIVRINFFKNFSIEIFLQKILRSLRVFFLKIDFKIFKLIEKLKERYFKKKEIQKNKEKDKYWNEIKNR